MSHPLFLGTVRQAACQMICLLFFATFSHAGSVEVPPVPFKGTVKSFIKDARGKTNGFILKDHSVIKMHFEALDSSLGGIDSVKLDEELTGTGQLVMSAPNKVYDRVEISKDGKVIVSDRTVTADPVEPAAMERFKALKDDSRLFAVSARLNGQVERLILEDGTNIEVPRGALIESSRLHLGEKISAQGVGAGRKEKFIIPMSVQGPGQAQLLTSFGESGGKWAVKRGKVKIVLLSLNGDVDGVIFTDNTVLRFEPLPFAWGCKISGDLEIQAAGEAVDKEIKTSTLLLTESNQVIDVSPRRRGMGPMPAPASGENARGKADGKPDEKSEQAPDQKPDQKPLAKEDEGRGSGRKASDGLASPMDPSGANATPYGYQAPSRMKDSARVNAVLRNRGGKIETFTLADETTVTVPSYARAKVPSGLKAGDPITVIGVGGVYAMGASMEAIEVKITPSAVPVVEEH